MFLTKIILSTTLGEVFFSLIGDRNNCAENCHQYWNIRNVCWVTYNEIYSSRQKSKEKNRNTYKNKILIEKVKKKLLIKTASKTSVVELKNKISCIECIVLKHSQSHNFSFHELKGSILSHGITTSYTLFLNLLTIINQI